MRELMVYSKRSTKLSLTILTCCLISISSCSSVELNQQTVEVINNCNQIDDYQKSTDFLLKANEAYSAGSYLYASKLYLMGIEEIGDSYLLKHGRDDSELILTLSEFEEKNGNVQISATHKKNVLESRLESYKINLKCR
jgi:hypothetical protein